jgi:hypothetical protein
MIRWCDWEHSIIYTELLIEIRCVHDSANCSERMTWAYCKPLSPSQAYSHFMLPWLSRRRVVSTGLTGYFGFSPPVVLLINGWALPHFVIVASSH